MFIDGELKDGSEALEQLVKKKRPKSSAKCAQDAPKSMHVSLFVPFVSIIYIFYYALQMQINKES